MNSERVRVGIFIFNEVEVLDFAGPYEVFTLATGKDNQKLFEVFTIGETGEILSARNGLKVLPALKFADEYYFDILIIPGGYGAEETELENEIVLSWIKEQYGKVNVLASVCTGALLLAECGILNHLKATTHWMDLNRLESGYPLIKVVRDTKFVDEGKVLTSGGISAGINMSFHLIERLFGAEIADATAKRMEYEV